MLEFIKIKNVYIINDSFKRMRGQATELEEILTKDLSDTNCYPKYTKSS